MSQTFSSLQAEFYARGFDYLNQDSAGQTRAKQWLNNAYHDICERYDWGFLETSLTSQTAPVTFTDLRQILSVVDTVQAVPLEGINRQALLEYYPDLSLTGDPGYWYLEGDTVKVMPVSTNLLDVRYVKVPTDLSADADEPLLPDRFRWLIVEGAITFAQRDDDDYNPAQSTGQTYENGLSQMALSLLTRNAQNVDAQVVKYATDGTALGYWGLR